MRALYTIGYEGASLPGFIKVLKTKKVSLLLDIRQLPQSRRAGFSKKVLSEALQNAGVEYLHIRQLGDPKPGREAARRGDMEKFRTIFRAHLELEASQQALKDVALHADTDTVALMCYERSPAGCHRMLVAERISALRSLSVVHLIVQVDIETENGSNGKKTRGLISAR